MRIDALSFLLGCIQLPGVKYVSGLPLWGVSTRALCSQSICFVERFTGTLPTGSAIERINGSILGTNSSSFTDLT
jgi:hypothetical protein